MTEYLKIARRLPRPTAQQLRDFADYVAQAHSWYKHLPLDTPGLPFVFYLDPNAGCDLLIGRGGTTTYRERTDATHLFHYSSLLTHVYRERFGYLEFASSTGRWILRGDSNGLVLCTRGLGPAVYIGATHGMSPFSALRHMILRLVMEKIPEEVRNGESVLKSYDPPTDYVSDRGWLRVPEAMLNAGLAQLTGTIHPFSSNVSLWQHLCVEGASDLQWPGETGGRTTIEHLRSIAQNQPQDSEAQLDLLLEPERARQKRLMVQAMETMLEAVSR